MKTPDFASQAYYERRYKKFAVRTQKGTTVYHYDEENDRLDLEEIGLEEEER